jgi:hypothetical protein
MIKSIPKGPAKRTHCRFRIYLSKEKYEELYHKATTECPTAAPVHDILELLLEYYLENEFVLSRKMILVDDKSFNRMSGAYRGNRYMSEEEPEEEVELWMKIESNDNKKFIRKATRDGMTKTLIMRMLIDFYLKNKFIIRSKIIRLNRYKYQSDIKK